MDSTQIFVNKELINSIIKKLENNNLQGFYAENSFEAINLINSLIPKKSKIAFAGSVTLFETGIKDYFLKNKKDYNIIDTGEKNISLEEKLKRRREGFEADFLLSSLNAITLNGEIVNVDGFGNRVSLIMFGPKNVILVAGVNKIVNSVEEGFNRVKLKAAPCNAKRLEKNTPCTKTGYCVDCQHIDRICNYYTVIKKIAIKDRIKVVLINENLGY